jgi:repressor of nif and glnA expression
VGTSAGRVGEAAQEDISAGTAEVGTAQGILGVDMAQDTLGVDMAQGTLGVDTQEEAGRVACTAAVDKTSFWSCRI